MHEFEDKFNELIEEKKLVLAKLYNLYDELKGVYDIKEAVSSEAYKKVIYMENYPNNFTEDEICEIYNENEIAQKELREVREFMDEVMYSFSSNN